jgi:outer membrane protein OmpA-like peptidoglycan-associated protein
MKFFKLSLVLVMSLCIISSCANWSKTAKGGAIGTAGGAAVGAGIGKLAGNTAVGAIMGAAIGGVAGASIGAYMDKQAEEMEADLEGASIERVGEGIKITFDSGILFDVNKADLKPVAKQNIAALSETLKKYDDTNILIEGHTDNSGADEYNQTLSEKRAASVADYLTSLGVDNSRVTTTGYGEQQPIADNSTAAGKTQNRRVEVAIFANKKLQKAAQRGDLDGTEY